MGKKTCNKPKIHRYVCESCGVVVDPEDENQTPDMDSPLYEPEDLNKCRACAQKARDLLYWEVMTDEDIRYE